MAATNGPRPVLATVIGSPQPVMAATNGCPCDNWSLAGQTICGVYSGTSE